MSNPSVGFSSAASITGSFAPHSSNTSAFTASPLQAKNSRYTSEGLSPQPANQSHLRANDVNVASPNPSLDYEQAGIDFVLTLERPCMSHLPYLLERGTAAGGQEQPSGHALMASCPPQPFKQLTDDIPFGYTNVNVNTTTNDGVPSIGNPNGERQRTWELKKADLATLMDLSKKLNLDGEVTPVMAWGMVLAHPRLSELKPQDLAKLADELVGKVGCYGFGAVLEEFEVRDALENILSTLPETVSAF
ncbi:hypothetical protein QBC42DRAFT_273085 [Cladorrhinum samala]|uniref:Uncharacterized protein n=1 Tax=Cladorrhinum samala TaxID=585594 RepID=A0AAV9HGR5_9PEZI|nr:hypothetical protein QBC42DRAFT_273085 [Cladorrhinum samala]